MRQSVRFALALCLLITLIAGGTVGYTLIEGWSVSDSLYMTMITVTTVGYGEVQSLNDAGDILIALGSDEHLKSLNYLEGA
jgi:voltage-gated potassium channel